MDKLEALPKWAQDRIRYLERDLHAAEAQLDAMAVVRGKKDVDVALGERELKDPPPGSITHGDWKREFLIPEGHSVTFWLEDGYSIQVEAGSRGRSPSLERDRRSVSVMSRFGRGLRVIPRVSNNVILEVEK